MYWIHESNSRNYAPRPTCLEPPVLSYQSYPRYGECNICCTHIIAFYDGLFPNFAHVCITHTPLPSKYWSKLCFLLCPASRPQEVKPASIRSSTTTVYIPFSDFTLTLVPALDEAKFLCPEKELMTCVHPEQRNNRWWLNWRQTINKIGSVRSTRAFGDRWMRVWGVRAQLDTSKHRIDVLANRFHEIFHQDGKGD